MNLAPLAKAKFESNSTIKTTYTRGSLDNFALHTREFQIVRCSDHYVWLAGPKGKLIKRKIQVNAKGIQYVYPGRDLGHCMNLYASDTVKEEFDPFAAFENMADRQESRNGNDYC
tara:strand:+ start:2367 stop:2711 length:345 start_codon:yes stop_codon:yes gene_type:complete